MNLMTPLTPQNQRETTLQASEITQLNSTMDNQNWIVRNIIQIMKNDEMCPAKTSSWIQIHRTVEWLVSWQAAHVSKKQRSSTIYWHNHYLLINHLFMTHIMSSTIYWPFCHGTKKLQVTRWHHNQLLASIPMVHKIIWGIIAVIAYDLMFDAPSSSWC